MSAFLTSLCWDQIGVQSYILTAPLRYKSNLAEALIEVPAKFVTDGESCPRYLPIINSLFGNVAEEPAVVHDWLYYTAVYTRDMADKVLLEAMDLIPGLPAWRKNGIYYGLRVGGWWAWWQHRRAGHSLSDFKGGVNR